MACVIGIDIGTYEAKGVVIDDTGTLLASAVRPHRLDVPQAGYAEHDAEGVWWGGLVELVGRLLASPGVDASSVAAICCSGIGPCVLPIMADGTALRSAILYGVDTRAMREVRELTERVGEAGILDRSGTTLSSQSAGPKIAWVRRHEPQIFERADLFVTCQGYLAGRLTGEWVMDHATAGYFHPFYRLAEQRWDVSGFEDIVGTDRLPRLVWSDEIVGTVTASAAAETGLPPGIPVIAGAADAPMEAFSAGVAAPGEMMIMYGSSHFLIEVVDRPVVGPTLYSAPYLVEGSFVLAGGTSTAGTLTRWFAGLVGEDPSADDTVFERLAAEAAASPPAARGLLALPHFSGERTPHNDPLLTGGILGLTLTHTRADVYRAVLESVAHSVADVLGEYDAVGAAPHSIAAVGGGTRNEVWLQAVSDVTGRDQRVVSGAGASMGDAMMAGVAIGLVDRAGLRAWVPSTRRARARPEYAAIYARQGEALRWYRDATRTISHRLREEGDAHNG